jgi:hypothetical protein
LGVLGEELVVLWDGGIVYTYSFFFLFFLASAVAAMGPLEIVTWAAVEVFWEASLEVVLADMEGRLLVGVVGV